MDDQSQNYLKEYLDSIKKYLKYYGFELVFKYQIGLNDKYDHLKNDQYANKYNWTILEENDKNGYRMYGDNLEELKKEFENFVDEKLLN